MAPFKGPLFDNSIFSFFIFQFVHCHLCLKRSQIRLKIDLLLHKMGVGKEGEMCQGDTFFEPIQHKSCSHNRTNKHLGGDGHWSLILGQYMVKELDILDRDFG